ncbi:hypothetical protein MKX08_004035 [Trichoderma sp. CBMAI-0020]|nr:hypothetical protein MKX08_004035 [Trichoderma sp. CBMAI-0020]
MQVHLHPSQNLETNGDPVGWESDHQARTALLRPGPGSWSSPQVLTTQRQIISLVTLQLPDHGLAATHTEPQPGINMPKHAKTCQNSQGPQSVNVG